MMRCCFIGASTTEGLGDIERKGWVGRLATMLPPSCAIFNLGVRGQTIFQVLERAEAECRARLLDGSDGRIVIGAPLNEHARLEDQTPRAARKDIIQCYATLFEKLRPIAPVALVGLPPIEASRMPFRSAASGLTLTFVNADIEAANSDLRQLCLDSAVPYIDIFSHLVSNRAYIDGLKRNDGLHSDADGYQEVAAHIGRSDAWTTFLKG